MNKILATGALVALLGGCECNDDSDSYRHTTPAQVVDDEARESLEQRLGERNTPASSGDAGTADADTEQDLTPPFETAEPPRPHLRNKVTPSQLTIYYLTNGWGMTNSDLRDLNRFSKLHKNATFYLLEGHADERGTDDYNIELGNNRAKGVAEWLRNFRHVRNIHVVSYGEARPAEEGSNPDAWRKNRRVEVIPLGHLITRGLDLLPADAYVLDASGSMDEYSEDGQTSKWRVVQAYDFPDDSSVFIFNGCSGLRRVTNLRRISPDCGTPMWDSVMEVIRSPRAYRRITVLTDGLNNQGRTGSSDIITAARGKNIAVSIIGVGVYSDATRDELIDVAKQTGGGFYIRQ
ncbi:OmpA family protein [Candidatus Woesearchaeota archaeon]|nr:OmpA family protein [Candidatus Woesearchaeota archaeon]